MDDPWGSPWAATDSDKDQKPASPVKSDLAPPPRAFLSASSSPRISAALDQSPWGGDDDGFGEWATTSDTPSAQGAHSVWAGGWGGSSTSLSSTPRDDALNKTSPIAWPGALATPKPTGGSASRHPSPDPWASEFSVPRVRNDGATTPRMVINAASPVIAPIDSLKRNGFDLELGPRWDASDASDAGDTNEKTTISDLDPTLANLEEAGDTGEQTRPVSAPISDVRESVESRQCQSPTPSNDNTDHEVERQDSPITSIDEEPRAPRPGSRKASGKVQELVVKFDGLARAGSQEPVPLQRRRSSSSLAVRKRDHSDDTVDFGDFEDADQDEPPIPLETPAEPQPGEEPATAEAPATQAPAREPDGPSPIAQFGPINFDVDLALVNKLFEDAVSEAVSDVKADDEVLDHVIRDSFTEISERKTWYRISRLGSSRRHNAADDESYRRVAWRSSTVHDDTIKIVRRWMEEDSIAGRVTLGGGISKTQKNMFGWDSSAEPVALDTIFGKRNSHSRASSLQSPQIPRPPGEGINGSPKQPSPKAPRVPTHRSSSSAQSAVASFGWSTNTPTSPGSTQAPDTIPGPSKEITAPSQLSISSPQATSPPKPGVPLSKRPTIPPDPVSVIPAQSAEEDGDDDDDDDEWGEMVSSPVVSSHAANDSVTSQFAAVAVSATPEHKGDFAAAAKYIDVPPTKDHPPLQAITPQTISSSMGLLAEDPSPTLTSKASIPSSTSASAVPAPLEPRTADPSIITTSPLDAAKTLLSHTDATNTDAPPQDDHHNAAQRIITNLPDLSYMLC